MGNKLQDFHQAKRDTRRGKSTDSEEHGGPGQVQLTLMYRGNI